MVDVVKNLSKQELLEKLEQGLDLNKGDFFSVFKKPSSLKNFLQLLTPEGFQLLTMSFEATVLEKNRQRFFDDIMLRASEVKLFQNPEQRETEFRNRNDNRIPNPDNFGDGSNQDQTGTPANNDQGGSDDGGSSNDSGKSDKEEAEASINEMIRQAEKGPQSKSELQKQIEELQKQIRESQGMGGDPTEGEAPGQGKGQSGTGEGDEGDESGSGGGGDQDGEGDQDNKGDGGDKDGKDQDEGEGKEGDQGKNDKEKDEPEPEEEKNKSTPYILVNENFKRVVFPGGQNGWRYTNGNVDYFNVMDKDSGIKVYALANNKPILSLDDVQPIASFPYTAIGAVQSVAFVNEQIINQNKDNKIYSYTLNQWITIS